MTSEQYSKISAPFRNEKRLKMLLFTNKLLTAIGLITYPLLLLYTFFVNIYVCIKILVVAASGFFLLTFVRKYFNKKRPYEALDIQPLIHKDTKGKSMPSRHVFSMTMIAMSWFLVSPHFALLLLLFSMILAYIRVVGGVHYPIDVIVGYLCAVLWSILYFI